MSGRILQPLLWILPVLSSVAQGDFAPGVFNFANRVLDATPPIDAPFFDCLGIPMQGAAYVAQLWVGPAGGVLAPVGDPVPFRAGAAAGYWRPEERVIPFQAGEVVWVQVRAWLLAAGNTYQEAAAAPCGAYYPGGAFVSPTLVLASGGVPDPVTGSPGPSANLTGLEPLVLICECIPEPSPLVLAGAGGALWFLMRLRSLQ